MGRWAFWLMSGAVAMGMAAEPARCEPDIESPLMFLDSYVATSQNGYPGSYRPYFTQASVDNEPRVNLVAAGGTYHSGEYRFRLIGQWGDSVSRNYAAEPKEALRYVQEGYISRAFSDRGSVDVGVFASHIGAEGWMSKDNLTYTRSFLAEFSPYYESGARFRYRFDERVTGEALLLNGWQNISDERHPALGTRIAWQDGRDSVVSSAFLGGESGGTRAFHALVYSHGFQSGAKVVGSVDIGYQSAPDLETGWWWGYALVGRAPVSERVSLSGRAEFYSDPQEIIVASSTSASFSASGISGGVDLRVAPYVVSRAEIRYLFSGDEVFATQDGATKSEALYIFSVSFANDLI